jgi:hypothetical protein
MALTLLDKKPSDVVVGFKRLSKQCEHHLSLVRKDKKERLKIMGHKPSSTRGNWQCK